MSIPIILQDISNYLSQYSIAISEKVEGEGRGGSGRRKGWLKVQNGNWIHDWSQHKLSHIHSKACRACKYRCVRPRMIVHRTIKIDKSRNVVRM